MSTTFTAEDFPRLEPGVYQAIFDRLEEPEEPGQYGPYLNWIFVVATADGPVEVLGRSSRPEFFTRSTKARQWCEAIMGRELANGETADPASLRATPVMLTIDTIQTERGDERNRIVNVRRAKNDGDSPTSALDPDFAAWRAEQSAMKAAADAANAEDPPTPSEPPADAAA